MLRNTVKTIGLVALLAALSSPALAQLPLPFPPLPPLPGLEIRIGHRPPPVVRHERIPVRPGRNHVYIRGFWDWQGDDWLWIPGRWTAPKRHGAFWIQPRYIRVGYGWRYEPGHWSYQRVTVSPPYRDGYRYREPYRDRHHNRYRDDRYGHRDRYRDRHRDGYRR